MSGASYPDSVLQASRAVFAAKARTFHWSARLLPADRRDDAAVVYAFCRLVDDTADEAPTAAVAAAGLDRLAAELEGRAEPRPLVAAFLDTAARRGLPLDAARELLAGVRSDLGVVRIADDDALLVYCYRVASTVGLLMCGVLGVRERDALPFAVDLGVAMQLTNICRDVAEDAGRGRVYLPATRLTRAGVTPEQVIDGTADRRAVARVVGDLLDLADRYYRSADLGLRHIPWRPRQAILVASRVYRAIGVRLRRTGSDALTGRVVVAPAERIAWSVRALAAGCSPRILGLGGAAAHDPALHRALRGLPGANG